MYVCACVHDMCTHALCVFVHMFVYVCAFVHGSAHVLMCVFVYVCICACMCVCVNICVYEYACAYVWGLVTIKTLRGGGRIWSGCVGLTKTWLYQADFMPTQVPGSSHTWKTCSLKQHTFLLSWLWRPKSKVNFPGSKSRCQQGQALPGGSRQNLSCFPHPKLHVVPSLALLLPPSSKTTHLTFPGCVASSPVNTLFPSHKDTCDYMCVPPG
jgi:hypothetical protein